ncbi:hypothetical protein GCM10023235_28750 [Kitasatospora terrestris]|uniref:Uncharacterized protein n=2 Tax=Kitasatospora terrestris TaxID=258051 RepID=A0ABP9DP56_9ACTN
MCSNVGSGTCGALEGHSLDDGFPLVPAPGPGAAPLRRPGDGLLVSAAMASDDHRQDWADWESELAAGERAALRAHRRAALRRRVLPGLAAAALLSVLLGALFFTATLDPGRRPPQAPPPTVPAPGTTKPPSSVPSLLGGR